MATIPRAEPVRTTCERCEGTGWHPVTRGECDWCEGVGYRQVYYVGEMLAEHLHGIPDLPEMIRRLKDYAALVESLEWDSWRQRRPLYAEAHSVQVMTLRTVAAALARLLLPDPEPPPTFGVVARVKRWLGGRRAA